MLSFSYLISNFVFFLCELSDSLDDDDDDEDDDGDDNDG